MTDYLTVIEILSIHKMMIDRYGGAHGIRDIGAVESVCFRPQSGYYEDIIAEASALMESLAINHPFTDGNKRVAFGATDVFLRINGADDSTIRNQAV
jgi:death on curing protein